MTVVKDRSADAIPALEVAKFFLSLDQERRYFVSEKMVEIEGQSTPTIGNLRLNKLLQITQMLYAAKEGKWLFEDKFWAFEHGGIIYEVYRQFHFLVNNHHTPFKSKGISSYLKIFLTKIFNYFNSYTDRQLEEFVNEDPAWFNIWERKNVRGSKEMPQSPELIKYYQNFVSHVVELVEAQEK